MNRVAAALTGLGLLLAHADLATAQPNGRTERLSNVTSPSLAFVDAEFQFQRSEREHLDGRGDALVVPIISAGILDDGSVRFVPRAMLFAPLYVYEDLQDETVDVRELMKAAAEDTLNGLILPAARSHPGLPDFTFSRIAVSITDRLDARKVAPLALPWNPATSSVPVVEIPYGLTHANAGTAMLMLQLSRAQLLAGSPDTEAEGLSQATSRVGNAIIQIWGSSLQRQVDARQSFDRALLETLYPVEWTDEDVSRWRADSANLFTIILAHEACHHILGHTSQDASISRIEQELDADRCAAEILVSLLPRFSPSQVDVRLYYYQSAAQYLSLSGFFLWPTEARSSATHPEPEARHRNVIAGIPDEVRATSPDWAAAIEAQPPLTAPLAQFSFLGTAGSPLQVAKKDEDTALEAFYALEFIDESIAKEMQTLGCGLPTSAHGPLARYFCGRIAVDRAFAILEMAFMLSRHEALAPGRRQQVVDLLDLAQAVVDTQSAPILATDLQRLRGDLEASRGWGPRQ